MVEFTPWPKIGRLNQQCVITEKLDGTNAAIRILPYEEALALEHPDMMVGGVDGNFFGVFAQSRSRFITPGNDNFGFANWVNQNINELVKLGEGIHFGEWWGSGIQRTYGLKEKRFSLFNTSRWANVELPACVQVVPVLYSGPFSQAAVTTCLTDLREKGSVAAPGFPNPEGIITYLVATRTMFKTTFDHPEGKWNEASTSP
jgi:hypothetical protein